jgi:hypothetical protein
MRLASIASIAALCGLAACATPAATGSTSRSATPGAEASAEEVSQVDHARMAAVESAALRRGVEVLWIHPPHKAR